MWMPYEDNQKSAEILFSFLRATKLNSKTADTLFPLLVKARRNLSLFQHHDGITGTARAEVVADYGDKLLNALKSCEKIICKTTEILLGSQKVDDTQPLKSFLTMELKPDFFVPLTFTFQNNNRFSYSSLPLDGTIHSNNNIILFNSLAQVRQEVVCINVNSLNTIIQRVNSQNIVPQQIGPVFNLTNSKLAVIPGIFELCFLATVPALGFERYHLIITEEKNRRAVIMSVNNAVNLSGFNVSIIKEKQFTLNNEYFTATFDSSTGYLMPHPAVLGTFQLTIFYPDRFHWNFAKMSVDLGLDSSSVAK
ncbi:unnamed protein product [Dracunculus medinensis]|uniref:Alpha-mann_mid domain-containing protein n=1 Tax=Dracunculus medinensis TaxID=318479 RepID=A0A0N4UP29_DRAME|nr:unnamed protein product [Dracunculus medinensis]